MPKKKEEIQDEVQEVKETKSSFTVFTPQGGEVRTYSIEIHGADAKKLAEEYAGKIGGSVR